ncbi:MAG: glycosyltransferase family 2 protein [Prevotella sp.]|nr:glycosyltransferase family 2 protein [Prevotella sp.]
MKQSLSILIPVYCTDCHRLVTDLCLQAIHINDLKYEIIVADDGSPTPQTVNKSRVVADLPGVRYIERKKNVGRAAIRNFLAQEAQYEWLLFVDGDMSVTEDKFLSSYLHSDTQQVAYGGYVVGPGKEWCLRMKYERQCAPMHSATERRKRPYQHFHTSNFLIRRDLMLQHPFDERFRGYGYEDVFFGKQLRQAGITIDHPDNPLGFLDFEENARFIDKTEESLRTLYTFRDELRGYSQMLTVIEGLHPRMLLPLVRLWHRLFGSLERRNLCGECPSLTIFKLYKLGYYLTLKNQSIK